MLRGTIAGLCMLSTTLLPGCSYFESLLGLSSNIEFSAKPMLVIATPYDFPISDVYGYRASYLFSEEKSTHIAGQEVSWAGSYGRTWVTDADTLLSPKKFHVSEAAPKTIRASIATTGPLYPIMVGKIVEFQFSRTGSEAPAPPHVLS